MGNIDVSVQKNVDFNKEVFKDINKFVTTNVNLNGDLAEAEADAEAFGTSDYYALAETDTFAIVDRTGGGTRTETFEFFGEAEVLGNVPSFNGINAGDPIFIQFSQAVDPGEDGQLPDADDLNATGVLADLNNSIPALDTGLPYRGPDGDDVDITNWNLTALEDETDPAPGEDLWTYTLDNTVTIDFGTRNLDRDDSGTAGDVGGERGQLTLTIPDQTIFNVVFEDPTGIEVTFGTEGPNGSPFWTFDPDPEDATLPSNNETFTTEAIITSTVDTLVDLAGYDIEAIGDFQWHVEVPNGGQVEAFAYSESTAALDLISGADLVI